MSRVHDIALHSWLQPQGSQVVAHWLSGMFCSQSLSSLMHGPGQQLISLRNFGGRQAQVDQPDDAVASQYVSPSGLQSNLTDNGTAQGTQPRQTGVASGGQVLAGTGSIPQPESEALPAVQRLHQLSEEPQELQEDLRCRLQIMHEHLRRKEYRQALRAFNTSPPPTVSHNPHITAATGCTSPFPSECHSPYSGFPWLHLAICTRCCHCLCRDRRERSQSCLTPPLSPPLGWGMLPWLRACCELCWPASSTSATWLTVASCGLCAMSRGPR